jgi:uncharacterized membrane protein
MHFSRKHFGAVAGALFGWLIIQYGLFKAVFVLAALVAGWYVGRVLDGEVELGDLVQRGDYRQGPEPENFE